jgi:hypothetical protein
LVFRLVYILAAQLGDEVRMLRQDAVLERVALLPAHRAHVQRVSRQLVCGLLQLASWT